MTLGAWLDTWMQLYVMPSGLAQNTKSCYNRAVRAVPEALGAVPLDRLTALDILPWILAVSREYPRAAQLDRVMLSRALNVAAKLRLCSPGIIDPDTCPTPVYDRSPAVVLDGAQLRRYMHAAASSSCAPVLMLCACGCRRGEARGVRWDAVRLSEGVLAVVGQRQGNGPLVPLKTAHSVRQIALPAILKRVLSTWPRSLSGWVCDATEHQVYACHRQLVADLGLPPVTLHGLRHSYATAAVRQGVPVKLVQGALGHASYTLTADLYADHLPPVSDVASLLF